MTVKHIPIVTYVGTEEVVIGMISTENGVDISGSISDEQVRATLQNEEFNMLGYVFMAKPAQPIANFDSVDPCPYFDGNVRCSGRVGHGDDHYYSVFEHGSGITNISLPNAAIPESP